MQGYDIIGDIHGHNLSLIALLNELGYTQDNYGTYGHADRKAIFLGDFIDRGPGQREVISIVKNMIDAGAALSVMGNHEFNAIAYATRSEGNDSFLRPHTDKNRHQHQAFLDAYANDQNAYNDAIDWFKTLPLWLDLGDIKVVHACWDKQAIANIIKLQNGNTYLTDELLHSASQKGSWQFNAVETLLKGKEITLPSGMSFSDKDGVARHEIRVRWWDNSAKTYQEAFVGTEHARTHIPDDEIIGDHLIEYSHDEPPVFLGHYWMEGKPEPLSKNIACTDYSVAKPGGKLVAYQWDGERILLADKYVTVSRQEK